MATIRRLLFHNADLDGDGRMTNSELTLYLEMKGFGEKTFLEVLTTSVLQVFTQHLSHFGF